MTELSFESIGIMIKGYIELLGLFPYFNDFKLESLQTTKNSMRVEVSTTHEVYKLNNDKVTPMELETHKKITTIYIYQETVITKGDS